MTRRISVRIHHDSLPSLVTVPKYQECFEESTPTTARFTRTTRFVTGVISNKQPVVTASVNVGRDRSGRGLNLCSLMAIPTMVDVLVVFDGS